MEGYRLFQRLVRITVILTMVGSVLMVAATSVSAADDASYNENCSSGRICIYRDQNLGFPLAATCGTCIDSNYSNDVYPNNAGPLNDSMTSAVNYRTTGKVLWYPTAGYAGTPFCLNHGVAALHVGSSFNDKASSHLYASGSC